MNTFNVRAAAPGDAPTIKHLAVINEMFGADEIDEFFDPMLAGFFDGSLADDQWLVACDTDGEIAAAAYVAPEPFSDRMWNLYFIATDPDRHGTGVGSTLLETVRQRLRDAGEGVARTLIVDTSSTGDYEQARGFYDARGFVEEARIRDFYGPGDDKVTFWTSLVD